MPCSLCHKDGHNRRTCTQHTHIQEIQTDTVVQDNITEKKKNLQCVICLEDIINQPKTELTCSHVFCTKCIMTNMSTGNMKCPMCRDVIIDPNREIQDLKQQIISMEQLQGEAIRQLSIITTELLKINIQSAPHLRQFIIRYNEERRVSTDIYNFTGMSLIDMARNYMGVDTTATSSTTAVHHDSITNNSNVNTNINTNANTTIVIPDDIPDLN